MRYPFMLILALLMILTLSFPMTAQDAEGREIEGLELLENYPAVEFWFKGYAGHYPQMAARRVACNEFIAADAELHYTGGERIGAQIAGQPGICSNFMMLDTIAPDHTFTLEAAVAEDDFIVVRYTGHYTYSTGSTGEKIAYPGMVMFQLENEQLKTIWNYFDWCDHLVSLCP